MGPFLLIKFSNWGKAFSLSNNWAKIGRQYVALKIPAHPQALSLSDIKWGAVSVPKKNFELPFVATFNNSFLSSSLFKIGKQTVTQNFF